MTSPAAFDSGWTALDMRSDQSRGRTAAELPATRSERELIDIIGRPGRALVARIARKLYRLAMSNRLNKRDSWRNLFAKRMVAVGGDVTDESRNQDLHGVRIAVNDELVALMHLAAIAWASEAKAPPVDGCSPAHGSESPLHSLEDRSVKHAFSDLSRRGLARIDTRVDRSRPRRPNSEPIDGVDLPNSASSRCPDNAHGSDAWMQPWQDSAPRTRSARMPANMSRENKLALIIGFA